MHEQIAFHDLPTLEHLVDKIIITTSHQPSYRGIRTTLKFIHQINNPLSAHLINLQICTRVFTQPHHNRSSLYHFN